GLREREVVRSDADAPVIAKHLPGKVLERSFEVADSNVFVDKQSLHLVEHRHMRGVVIAAVDLSWNDDTDWRPVCLHVADLHRRCVGAQQEMLLSISALRRCDEDRVNTVSMAATAALAAWPARRRSSAGRLPTLDRSSFNGDLRPR